MNVISVIKKDNTSNKHRPDRVGRKSLKVWAIHERQIRLALVGIIVQMIQK